MVKTCCVKGCKSETFAGCNISFHSFPKNEECRQKWQQLIQVNIGKNSVVCSRHFTPKDFVILNSRNTLVPDAIPSMFPVAKEKQISVLGNIQIAPPNSAAGSVSQDLSPLIGSTDEPPTKIFCATNHRSVPVQTIQSSLRTPEESLKRKVKILSQRLRRRDAEIENMKELLEFLRKKCDNFDEVKDMISNNYPQIHLEFNSQKTHKGLRYTNDLKQFALSLYFYSPRAYLFLRNHVTLPHPATLRRELSTKDCNVGFMEEVLEFLKITAQKEDYLKNVALIFDAMSIKSDIKPDKKTDKVFGYVDFGGIVSNDSKVLATEVLVIQIVSFKQKFKCPIGYFFINKISANVQAQLIMTALRFLHDINITVRSITCDGTFTNRKTYEALGCNFDPSNMVTSFKHPLQGTQVHCIFDPPHMIKLARSIFAETQLSSELGDIDFNFIKELHNLQKAEGLRLANKLCDAHINFFGKKMNVRLATQLLSASVADALDFLRQSGNRMFQNSEATVEYIRWLDRVFDIFNAKNPFGKGFKSPLKLSNANVWTNVLSETRDYLLTLKIDGVNSLSHNRRMAFLGMIADTYSIKNLAIDLLKDPEAKLDYFLPYKCSQDHIEMFFSCIRARGGHNDNPNALQFRYALRKLLFRNSVTPSVNANCTDDSFETCSVFAFGNAKRRLSEPVTADDPADADREQILLNYLDNAHLSDYKLNVLYYIAGTIVNKLLDKVSCKYCKSALLAEKKANDHNYALNVCNFSSFTTFIDRGDLKFVSRFVFEVIKYCEKLYVAITSPTESLRNVSKKKMLVLTVQHFSTRLGNLIEHPVQSLAYEDSHELMLVKLVSDSYFTLRLFHHAKLKSMAYLGKRVGMRQKLHKTILFSNV